MLYQEYVSQTDRGVSVDELRQSLLGGRYVSAVTGSAPISPELKAWVEDFVDMHLMEGYGSTEAGAVFVDGHIRRPPVLDYKLVDVPELGYFGTDQPPPPRRAAGQVRAVVPRLLQAPRGHRRGVRRGRFLQDR